MQKKSFLLFFVILLSSSYIHAQTKTTCTDKEKATSANKDHQAITETIETYFEGWMTGDTTKLGTAMHATCQLKNIKDDGVIIFDRATYLSFFKPRPRRENSEGRIIHIHTTGDIGSAKCELETPGRLFTDYFNLMKVKGQWYIVDKIATSVAKE